MGIRARGTWARLFGLAAVSLLMACGTVGPSLNQNFNTNYNQQRDGYVPPQADAMPQSIGSVSGTVWAPGNAPGMVPAGHEFPVFGVLVYLANSKPDPIPQSVYCEECIDPPLRHDLTDHQGNFKIENVFEGDYWLIIQKGQFRRSLQISVARDQTLVLASQDTTLPSVQDYTNGFEIPRMALASGNHDNMEDIFGKMGIGQVGADGRYLPNTAAGHIDIYANGNWDMDLVAVGQMEALLEDYAVMSQYHIIFIPCASQTYGGGAGLASAPMAVLGNLRRFVSDGGKLYVTDWSGEYVDNVFPEQIRFASDHDTPPTAWNGTTWNTGAFGDADGSPSYESEHALATDPDLNAWLHGQLGPTVDMWGAYGVGNYDASNFRVEGNWDHIEQLVSVNIGQDEEGLPVFDNPITYIIGDEDGNYICENTPGCTPLTVTFEPVGCGRVLYSTYHTTENTHTGLVPQERVLVYLIMEIGVCKSGPVVR